MVKILHGDGKAILTFFVGAIIAIVFLASIADAIFNQTNTFDVANETLVSSNGTTLLLLPELQGKFVTDIVMYNDTNDAIILDAGNWTLFNKHVNASNGVETVKINVTAGDAGGIQDGNWNISYTYQPNGYLERSADRSIVLLIIIFGALAILIFALVVFIQDGTLGEFMRNNFKRKK